MAEEWDYLDGAPMIQHRGDYVCCLLCLRQFTSEKKVRKHLAKSALHADNLASASAAGRVRAATSSTESSTGKRAAAGLSQPPAKRSAAPDSAPPLAEPQPVGGGASGGGLSTLQQMELF